MSTRFHVATRKGLFAVECKGSGWSIERASFLGDNCTLLMHDDDATKRGVATGDLVAVTSSGGQIAVPVEVTDAIMPGVVSMPHGWGHGKPGTRMAIANDSPGVNTNILSPPTFIDEPSGNGALNGIPVTVTPVQT